MPGGGVKKRHRFHPRFGTDLSSAGRCLPAQAGVGRSGRADRRWLARWPFGGRPGSPSAAVDAPPCRGSAPPLAGPCELARGPGSVGNALRWVLWGRCPGKLHKWVAVTVGIVSWLDKCQKAFFVDPLSLREAHSAPGFFFEEVEECFWAGRGDPLGWP